MRGSKIFRSGHQGREVFAHEIFFDNTETGYSATNVQDAVNEAKSDAAAAVLAGERSLLSSTVVDMKTAVTTALYVVPAGKVLVITGIIVRQPTASLAGGTDYDIGNIGVLNWQAGVDLSAITSTAGTKEIEIVGNSPVFAAAVSVGIAPQTGSTLASNATVDLFGYLVEA
ncbi:MAG: hypothetical protein E4G89_04300 [Methanothrix sp.]|nr:MAG: hypothetical protein E4G89_04300 [Methanothrix sp.]